MPETRINSHFNHIQSNYRNYWGLDLPTHHSHPLLPTQSLSSSAPSSRVESPFRLAMINLSFPTFKEFIRRVTKPLRLQNKLLRPTIRSLLYSIKQHTETTKIQNYEARQTPQLLALSIAVHSALQRRRHMRPQLNLVDLLVQARNRYTSLLSAFLPRSFILFECNSVFT